MSEVHELIPVQGYPGNQEQERCVHCDGLMGIKELIWDHGTKKRVSMRCKECGNIRVSTKSFRMFRERITIRRVS